MMMKMVTLLNDDEDGEDEVDDKEVGYYEYY